MEKIRIGYLTTGYSLEVGRYKILYTGHTISDQIKFLRSVHSILGVQRNQ